MMIRYTFLIVVLATSLAGCGKANKTGTAATANATPVATPTVQRPLLISPEDLLTVRSNALASGPSITGSVQPKRRADLRAEVSAVVLQVLRENGDLVRRGDLLVRLDDMAIRDSFTSAEASARAAAQAYEQAERQFQRLVKLRESGLVSASEVEDAEIRRNNTQSDLEAAKTRAAVARQQLQRTEVRAPFDGLVSDRKVSAGDTAQIGKELLKVIDPGSLRFEGRVSADAIGELRAGQTVLFRVQGLAQPAFEGTVARVNPAADPVTRQVEVLVDFAQPERRPALAGLYAEGRVATRDAAALTIAPTALVKEGERAFVWRAQAGELRKVAVELGERDPRTGEFALKSGLAPGEQVLRYPSTGLSDGRKIEMASRK